MKCPKCDHDHPLADLIQQNFSGGLLLALMPLGGAVMVMLLAEPLLGVDGLRLLGGGLLFMAFMLTCLLFDQAIDNRHDQRRREKASAHAGFAQPEKTMTPDDFYFNFEKCRENGEEYFIDHKGNKEGEYKKYNDEGRVVVHCHYHKNLRHGAYREYHTNGRLKLDCHYVYGDICGEYRQFDAMGQLNIHAFFARSLKVHDFLQSPMNRFEKHTLAINYGYLPQLLGDITKPRSWHPSWP